MCPTQGVVYSHTHLSKTFLNFEKFEKFEKHKKIPFDEMEI